MTGTSSRTSRVTSRAQRIPHTTAMTTPIAATIQLMINPTRRHATPIAKAIGQRLGPGACGVSLFVSLNSRPALDSISRRSRVSTTCRLSRRGDSARCEGWASGQRADPVLGPATGHELAHVFTHRDLLGPGTCILFGELVCRVDAELPAVELPSGRVVEVVERSLRDQDVALRV